MKMKIIQTIKIDGKNWNDLINLPCVQSLTKSDETEADIPENEYENFLEHDYGDK